MTLLGRVVFALLVGATFSAFFVAQRLRSAPTAIGEVKVMRFFSPNGDGRRDVAPVSFRVEKADDITVDVVNDAGERVRRLATAIAARPDLPVSLSWNGRDDDGGRAADGLYRLRVALRRSGRSVVVPQGLRVDTTAPRPVIVRARRPGQPPPQRGPVIVQPGEHVVVAVRRATRLRRTRFAVWRTDGGAPREVARFRAPSKASSGGEWDGLVAGAPAPAGTYMIVPTVQDKAGNRGSAPAELPPQPGTVPGRPGVLVRRLAVQPPLEPVRAGQKAQFFVDSRGRPYRWSVRRVGGSRPVRKGAGKADAPLAIPAPRGVSGAYLLEVRSAGATARVPFLVQSPERQRILVVLPALSWLGEDAIDDDGDGLPNQLTNGTSVRVPRPLAGEGGGGLPAGFAEQQAPLLAFL
ncbi:MAG TPA: FlgD immunoglobulin-like domain containing protein, partial [Solirubrobacteraceae bacterium]